MEEMTFLCHGWSPDAEGLSGGEVVMVMSSLTPAECGLTTPGMRSMEAEIATPPLPHHSSKEKDVNQTSSMMEVIRSHSEL